MVKNTSQSVTGTLGVGPPYVIGKYSNKAQLLRSYSCIQVNWENMGNYFLSRLFLSPLKVPALQNTSVLCMEGSLYVHMSHIGYYVFVAWNMEIPNIIVYPAWPWHCNESDYIEITCPFPLTVWTVIELTRPVTGVHQGVQNKGTKVFCFCKCGQKFLTANQGPKIYHVHQFFTTLSNFISLCKLYLLPPSVIQGHTALHQIEEFCNSAVSDENQPMSVISTCCWYCCIRYYTFLYLLPHLILFRSLSDDRSKASSKTIPPHSAIQSLLFQMRVSSPVLKVIQ